MYFFNFLHVQIANKYYQNANNSVIKSNLISVQLYISYNLELNAYIIYVKQFEKAEINEKSLLLLNFFFGVYYSGLVKCVILKHL